MAINATNLLELKQQPNQEVIGGLALFEKYAIELRNLLADYAGSTEVYNKYGNNLHVKAIPFPIAADAIAAYDKEIASAKNNDNAKLAAYQKFIAALAYDTEGHCSILSPSLVTETGSNGLVTLGMYGEYELVNERIQDPWGAVSRGNLLKLTTFLNELHKALFVYYHHNVVKEEKDPYFNNISDWMKTNKIRDLGQEQQNYAEANHVPNNRALADFIGLIALTALGSVLGWYGEAWLGIENTDVPEEKLADKRLCHGFLGGLAGFMVLPMGSLFRQLIFPVPREKIYLLSTQPSNSSASSESSVSLSTQ